MTDYIERFASSPAPKFADFGHVPGIHFPAAEGSSPSGDGAAAPAVKPITAPESAPAVTSPDGASPAVEPEESRPADGGSRHPVQGSTPEAGAKPVPSKPADHGAPLPEGVPKPSTSETVVSAPEQGPKRTEYAPVDNGPAPSDQVSAPGPIASALKPKPTVSDAAPGVKPSGGTGPHNPEHSSISPEQPIAGVTTAASDLGMKPPHAPSSTPAEVTPVAPSQTPTRAAGNKSTTDSVSTDASLEVSPLKPPAPVAELPSPAPAHRAGTDDSTNAPKKAETVIAGSLGSLGDNSDSTKGDSTKVRSKGDSGESGTLPEALPQVKPLSAPSHGTSDKQGTPENTATRSDATDVLKPSVKSSTEPLVSPDLSPLPGSGKKHGDPSSADTGKTETREKDSPAPLKSLMEGLVALPSQTAGERTEVKPLAADKTTDDLKRNAGSTPTLDAGSLDPINRKLPEAVPAIAPGFELPKATTNNSLETSDKRGTKPTASPVGEMLGGFAITDDAGLRPSQAKHPNDTDALPLAPGKLGEIGKRTGDLIETAASLVNGSRKSITDNNGSEPLPIDAPKLSPTLKHDPKSDLQLPGLGGTLGDLAPNQSRPRNSVTSDNLFGSIAPSDPTPQARPLFELPKAKPLNQPTTEVGSTDPVVVPRQFPPAVEHFPKPLTPENNSTSPSPLANLIEIQTRRTAETAIQSALFPKDPPGLPTISPSASPRSAGDFLAAPIVHKEALPLQTMTNSSVNPLSAPEEQRPPRVSPAAVQFIAASAEGFLRRPGSAVDNGDQTKKASATASDVGPILSGSGKLNNKVEDTPSQTPRPERSSADSPVAPLSTLTRAERNNNGDDIPRPAGGASPVAEASKPVFTAQPAFKSSALDRNTAIAAQDAVPKVVSLDAAKSGNAAADLKTVYSLDSLKTSIVGLNGKEFSSTAKSVEVNGLTAKTAIAGVESIKTAGIEVLPLGVKRLNSVNDSGIKTIVQTVGTLDGVKLDSVSINGLKTSLISFVSGQTLIAGDKGFTVKSELSPIKVEIPTAGISSGVFINGATFNTSHGVAGSIKIDVSGVGKEGPIAISAVKDPAVKVEATVAGVKTDAISIVKDGSIAIIQTTSTGKFINVDITSTVKTDSGVNTGSVSINGTTMQPTATAIKGDVTAPGKSDATGRPIDGVKCGDSAAGTVRGTVLTPGIVSAIANAIRLGYPIPEGITLENGTFAVTYGNEVLYFPGLRAALKFAEVVGLIDAESENVEEEKDESLLKPSAGSNVRVRYSVKDGESLQSIAESELGDARFSDLIMTINRSEILYRLTDEGKVPFVYPGQLILLPSEQELNIYRKNIFGKNGTRGSAMSGVSSAEITVEDESRESGRAVRKALHDEYIANNIALQPGRPKTTVRDMPKFQLSFNNIGPVITEEDDAQDYTHTVVNLPVKTEERKTTDNLSADMPMASDRSTDERVAGVAVVRLSVIGEQAVFLHASVDGADQNDTVIVNVEPVVEMERLLDVRALANGVRALVTEVPRNPGQFFIRLEMRIDDNWTVIASYDGCGDSTRRVRHSENGTRTSMQVNLPAHAVKTMAIEDFVRNWSTYKANYENNNIGRIQIESVQPMPISLRGLGGLAVSR